MNIPYMTLITFVILLILIFIDDLKLFIKIASYGFISIGIYVIFIVALFFYSMYYKGFNFF